MVITTPLVIAWLLTALQLAVLVWDVTRYRIPNKLSLLLAAGFLPFALLLQPVGWYWHLLIAGGALLIGYLLFSLRVIGGGDAKWLAACCLWTGVTGTGHFLAVTALLGGIFTLLLLVIRGIARGMVGKRDDLPRLLQPFGPVPYGVAISLAFLWLLWQGRMPGLESVGLSF